MANEGPKSSSAWGWAGGAGFSRLRHGMPADTSAMEELTHRWRRSWPARGGRSSVGTEVAGEIHPGKNRSIKPASNCTFCSGRAWAAFLLSEEPSN